MQTLVQEDSPVMQLVVGTDGTVKDANRSLMEMLGYDRSELLGRHVLEFVAPEDSGRVLEQLQGALDDQYYASDVEVNIHAKDGTIHSLLFSRARSLTDERNHVIGDLLTGIDVTDRKEAERMLREHERRLMEARTVKTLARLAGGIAHCFNNLLTVIQGNARILQAERAGDKDLVRTLEHIVQASRHGAALTEKLLAFADVHELKLVPMDIHEILHAVVGLVRPAAGGQISVETDLKAASAVISGDVGRLQGALLELGLNACDALPGGGKIIFATELVTLDDLFCRTQSCDLSPGRYIQISVTDTGVGMDARTMESAFEPFFTTKDSAHRTGLGLTCVHGCVQAHGGTIRLASRGRHGTRVTIYLPLLEDSGQGRGPLRATE